MSRKWPRLDSDVYFSCWVVFLSKCSEEFENHRWKFQKSRFTTLWRHLDDTSFMSRMLIWINNQVTLLWVIVSLYCFHFSFVEWLYVMTIWLYDYTTIWNDYMTIMSVRLCHRDVFLFWHTSKKLCIMFSGM